MVAQGDLYWAALPDPIGSGPGFRHPVVIVQGDSFNSSSLATTVVVPLTSNTQLAMVPGNVLLPSGNTGLPKDSVANVSQIVSIDRSILEEHVGHLSDHDLEEVLDGIAVLLGS